MKKDYITQSSKKGFIVPLFIAIIALFAVGGYAYEKHKTVNVYVPAKTEMYIKETGTDKAEMQTTVSTQNQMSLKDLLALSAPQECTTTFTSHGVETHGTVKVSEGKVRADYMTTVSGKIWNVHALVDGSNSYTWMDGMAQGFKVAMKANTEAKRSTMNSSEGTDVNQKMNVTCKPWSEDKALLNVPTNISFMTIGDVKVPTGAQLPSAAVKVQGSAY